MPVPGLDFVKKSVRTYPQGTLASHVLGYVNDEADLRSGIEEVAKDVLLSKPEDMVKQLEVDGKGTPIAIDQRTDPSVVSVPKAEDVVLTLDTRLQFLAESALKAGIEKSKAKRGSLIMMDPRTGEILAFANYPNYNPEQFLQADQGLLKNWAVSDVYPPGSVFKILTVACGLESGVINAHSRIQDTGKMKVGGWTITNYDYYQRGAPGTIDLIYLLEHSSNIASAKISLMMTPQQHWKLLKDFGMGQKTDIDLPGESQGILLPVQRWDVSTHASLGYGYGVATTPVQMVAAIGAIANGGQWIPPHLIKRPAHHNAQPKARQVIRPETAKTVTRLLYESIAKNKKHPVNEVGVAVAGKTGTSRKPSDEGRGYGSDLYTSFVGYYPAQSPKVVMMVVVDSPHMAEAWGSTVAAPIFRDVAKESLHILGLEPDTMTADKVALGRVRTPGDAD